MEREIYLGDGAYVRYEGYEFTLYTSDGLQETNHVVLEPDAVKRLFEFVDRMRPFK